MLREPSFIAPRLAPVNCRPLGRRIVKTLRQSTLDEFIEWYLAREQRKGGRPVPDTRQGRQATMEREHTGKLRTWFAAGRWSIVVLDRDDFERLVFLESPWTISEHLLIDREPNYRLLRQVAANALASDYLGHSSDGRHAKYFQAIRDCHMRLECSSRLAICDLEPAEIAGNPAGSHYLHDGAGRGLAYMIFLQLSEKPFEPVEAFLVQR